MTSRVTKLYTGLAGLPVCKDPHRELSRLYSRILRNLETLPKESQYRVSTEKLIQERKSIVESTPDPQQIEAKIGAGQCEELIEQANHELYLVSVMKEHKPWEPLVEKPKPDQWKWPL